MEISKTTLSRMAELSRLNFSDEQLEEFLPQFEELARLALSLQGGADNRAQSSNALSVEQLAPDFPSDSTPREQLVADEYFSVGRVIK